MQKAQEMVINLILGAVSDDDAQGSLRKPIVVGLCLHTRDALRARGGI